MIQRFFIGLGLIVAAILLAAWEMCRYAAMSGIDRAEHNGHWPYKGW